MSVPPLQPPRESFDVSHEERPTATDKRGSARGSMRETFSRAWTDNTGFARGFTRAMTECAFLNAITEDAWTRKLIDEVSTHHKKGVEGDIPGNILGVCIICVYILLYYIHIHLLFLSLYIYI